MNAAFQKAVDLAMWTSQVFILLFVLVDFISIIIWLITVTTVVVFLLFFSKCIFFKLNVIHIALMHNEITLKHFMLYVNDVKNNREKQP